MAKAKLRWKIPDLIEALIGRCDDHHAVLVAAMLAQLNDVETALTVLNAQIVVESAPWTHQIELLQTFPGSG